MKMIHVGTLLCTMLGLGSVVVLSCNSAQSRPLAVPGATGASGAAGEDNPVSVDPAQMPSGKFGEVVRYGQELMYNTAYYIGPEGVNGKYTRNKMNCTNCHQNGGTKPY